MNRGSENLLIRRESAAVPSMRPRFMNRGSAGLRGIRTSCAGAFNEAPIHESGKLDSVGRESDPSGPFNEAPIHESGKWKVNSIAMRRNDDPSMRPRFMNRGSEVYGTPFRKHAILQ